MRKARLGVLVVLAALIVGVLPAAAGGNDWGTWTFTGHGTSWSGTVVDAHSIKGVVMGLKSRVMFNRVLSFTLGGKKCKTSKQLGTGYCYHLNVPAHKKLAWKLTTRTRVNGSDKLGPCIEYRGAFHCRFGNG
jgi:hypothetical protein